MWYVCTCIHIYIYIYIYTYCRIKSAVYKKRGIAQPINWVCGGLPSHQPDPHAVGGICRFYKYVDSDIVDMDMLIWVFVRTGPQYTYIYVYIYICIHIYVYIYIYVICIYIYMYIYMYNGYIWGATHIDKNQLFSGIQHALLGWHQWGTASWLLIRMFYVIHLDDIYKTFLSIHLLRINFVIHVKHSIT